MNHTITRTQFLLLTTSFITGSSLLMAPGLTAANAKNDAWLAMLLAVCTGLFLNILLVFMLKKYSYASIFVITERAAGPFFGGFINLLIVFYALHLAAYVIRNLSNFMISSVNTEGTSSIYEIPLILVVIYTIYFGVNNIARVNEFFLPIMLVLLFASFGLVANQFEFSNLKPFLSDGIQPLVQAVYPTLGFPFIEIMTMFSIISYVKNKKNLGRLYLIFLFASGIILVITVLLAVGIQGYDLVQRQSYSTFEMMRNITVVKLFERIEVLIGTFWIFGIFVKIALCFLTAMLGLQSLSKHRNYKPFLIPSAIIVWVMSLEFHPGVVDFTQYVNNVWTLWWLTLYLIVCFVLLIGIVRKQHSQKTNKADRTVKKQNSELS